MDIHSQHINSLNTFRVQLDSIEHFINFFKVPDTSIYDYEKLRVIEQSLWALDNLLYYVGLRCGQYFASVEKLDDERLVTYIRDSENSLKDDLLIMRRNLNQWKEIYDAKGKQA